MAVVVNVQKRVSVGTSSTILLANNPNRVGCILKPEDNTDVFLQLDGTDATTGTSLPITKDQPYQSTDMLGNQTVEGISAIVSTGTVNVYVVEFTKQ